MAIAPFCPSSTSSKIFLISKNFFKYAFVVIKNFFTDVSGRSWPVVPLTADFVSGAHYIRRFLPLMFHELWAMISQEVEKKREERREIAPVMVMEVLSEIGKPFKQVFIHSSLSVVFQPFLN